MKITQLQIKGFKSLKNIKWTPGDLNVIIGPNASGKSNFLRFLELTSMSAKGELGKYIISSGGMQFIAWNNEATEIYFSVDAQVFTPSNYQLSLFNNPAANGYLIANEKLIAQDINDKNISVSLLERNHEHAIIIDQKGNKREKPLNQLPWGESLLSIYNNWSEYNSYISEYKQFFEKIKVYHDINVTGKSHIRQSAVSRVETHVDEDGENLISVLHTHYTNDKSFKNNIDAAMKTAFGEQYEALSFPPAADQRIQLGICWKDLKWPSPAIALSDGTLRFLFLITVLACPELPSIIAIDEPETGLHPGMLPIIAEFAAEASKRSQIIITTHSAQLLDSFSDIKPTTTVTSLENGETKMNVIKDKELEYWLKEYSMGSLYVSGELEDMI